MVTIAAGAERKYERDESGRWLCNVDAGCKEPAVEQAVLACETGCDAAVVQHEKIIDTKKREAADHERALELVRDEMQRAVEAGEPAQLSAAERAAVQLGHENLKRLRADVEKLEAARARVAEEHTHPVFACAGHLKAMRSHEQYAAGLRSLEGDSEPDPETA